MNAPILPPDAKLLAVYDGQRTLGQSKYAAQLVVASRHGAAAHARLLVVLAARRQGAARELLNLGAL